MPTNKKSYLESGKTYHIYNRAIGDDLLFRRENDYFFFMQKFKRYILPVAEIYSYCLMPNHFHFLISIRQIENLNAKVLKKSQAPNQNFVLQTFSNFFNSYSKSYNKIYSRKGRLFLYPFKRILVDNNEYLKVLVSYIHRNPIHHGFVKTFSEWKHSSYNAYVSDAPTIISKEYIIGIFGSKQEFVDFHESNKMKPGILNYFIE